VRLIDDAAEVGCDGAPITQTEGPVCEPAISAAGQLGSWSEKPNDGGAVTNATGKTLKRGIHE